MSKIVSLGKLRKTRDRAARKAQADANAAKFGRSKSERILDAARTEKARQMLDGHHRDKE